MNQQEITEKIIQTIQELIEKPDITIEESTPLIGRESFLDSMKLVELCLVLEDMADDLDFEFDWTSEEAMSTSKSMFRSVASLSEAFFNQYSEQS